MNRLEVYSSVVPMVVQCPLEGSTAYLSYPILLRVLSRCLYDWDIFKIRGVGNTISNHSYYLLFRSSKPERNKNRPSPSSLFASTLRPWFRLGCWLWLWMVVIVWCHAVMIVVMVNVSEVMGMSSAYASVAVVSSMGVCWSTSSHYR